MKETNVLEAIHLCVNGNPVDYSKEIAFLRLSRVFQELSNVFRKIERFTWPQPSFEKGSHERIQGLNKMTESKRYSEPEIDQSQVIHRDPDMLKENKQFPEPRNSPKPPTPRTITGLKEVDLKKKYGITDDDLIMPHLKKGLPVYMAKKESRFSKFKKWLIYWLTPFSDNDASHRLYLNYPWPAPPPPERPKKNKYLKRLRHGKKRYSISTPITKSWHQK